MRKQYAIWFILTLLLLPLSGSAMSFFKKQTLFSEVNGVVLLNGKPIQHIEVIRSYSELGDKKSESAFTNTEGVFHFEKITKTQLFEIGFFPPSEIRILQEIIIKYQDKEIDGWVFSKHDYENDSELGGKPINIICELESEPIDNATPSGRNVYGICKFD